MKGPADEQANMEHIAAPSHSIHTVASEWFIIKRWLMVQSSATISKHNSLPQCEYELIRGLKSMLFEKCCDLGSVYYRCHVSG